MTLKHTPGQWTARPDPNAYLQDDWCVGVGDKIDKVAVCSKRDAQLISAAPDLLEALQLCRQHMYNHSSNTADNAFDKLCAAIAKATNTM